MPAVAVAVVATTRGVTDHDHVRPAEPAAHCINRAGPKWASLGGGAWLQRPLPAETPQQRLARARNAKAATHVPAGRKRSWTVFSVINPAHIGKQQFIRFLQNYMDAQPNKHIHF